MGNTCASGDGKGGDPAHAQSEEAFFEQRDTWSPKQVLRWARQEGFSRFVVRGLERRRVDGPRLRELRRGDLGTDIPKAAEDILLMRRDLLWGGGGGAAAGGAVGVGSPEGGYDVWHESASVQPSRLPPPQRSQREAENACVLELAGLGHTDVRALAPYDRAKHMEKLRVLHLLSQPTEPAASGRPVGPDDLRDECRFLLAALNGEAPPQPPPQPQPHHPSPDPRTPGAGGGGGGGGVVPEADTYLSPISNISDSPAPPHSHRQAKYSVGGGGGIGTPSKPPPPQQSPQQQKQQQPPLDTPFTVTKAAPASPPPALATAPPAETQREQDAEETVPACPSPEQQQPPPTPPPVAAVATDSRALREVATNTPHVKSAAAAAAAPPPPRTKGPPGPLLPPAPPQTPPGVLTDEGLEVDDVGRALPPRHVDAATFPAGSDAAALAPPATPTTPHPPPPPPPPSGVAVVAAAAAAARSPDGGSSAGEFLSRSPVSTQRGAGVGAGVGAASGSPGPPPPQQPPQAPRVLLVRETVEGAYESDDDDGPPPPPPPPPAAAAALHQPEAVRVRGAVAFAGADFSGYASLNRARQQMFQAAVREDVSTNLLAHGVAPEDVVGVEVVAAARKIVFEIRVDPPRGEAAVAAALRAALSGGGFRVDAVKRAYTTHLGLDGDGVALDGAGTRDARKARARRSSSVPRRAAAVSSPVSPLPPSPEEAAARQRRPVSPPAPPETGPWSRSPPAPKAEVVRGKVPALRRRQQQQQRQPPSPPPPRAGAGARQKPKPKQPAAHQELLAKLRAAPANAYPATAATHSINALLEELHVAEARHNEAAAVRSFSRAGSAAAPPPPLPQRPLSPSPPSPQRQQHARPQPQLDRMPVSPPGPTVSPAAAAGAAVERRLAPDDISFIDVGDGELNELVNNRHLYSTSAPAAGMAPRGGSGATAGGRELQPPPPLRQPQGRGVYGTHDFSYTHAEDDDEEEGYGGHGGGGGGGRRASPSLVRVEVDTRFGSARRLAPPPEASPCASYSPPPGNPLLDTFPTEAPPILSGSGGGGGGGIGGGGGGESAVRKSLFADVDGDDYDVPRFAAAGPGSQQQQTYQASYDRVQPQPRGPPRHGQHALTEQQRDGLRRTDMVISELNTTLGLPQHARNDHDHKIERLRSMVRER